MRRGHWKSSASVCYTEDLGYSCHTAPTLTPPTPGTATLLLRPLLSGCAGAELTPGPRKRFQGAAATSEGRGTPPGRAGRPRADPHRPQGRSARSRPRNYNSQHASGPDKRRARSPHRFLIDVRDGHSASRSIAVPPMAGERRRALPYAAAGPGVKGERCRPGASVVGVGAAAGSRTGAPGPALPFWGARGGGRQVRGGRGRGEERRGGGEGEGRRAGSRARPPWGRGGPALWGDGASPAGAGSWALRGRAGRPAASPGRGRWPEPLLPGAERRHGPARSCGGPEGLPLSRPRPALAPPGGAVSRFPLPPFSPAVWYFYFFITAAPGGSGACERRCPALRGPAAAPPAPPLPAGAAAAGRSVGGEPGLRPFFCPPPFPGKGGEPVLANRLLGRLCCSLGREAAFAARAVASVSWRGWGRQVLEERRWRSSSHTEGQEWLSACCGCSPAWGC